VPALGFRAHRGHDPRHVGGVAAGQQPEVELDHVGIQERHDRERAAVGAHVVERDAPPALAQAGERAQHDVGLLGERALGDLHHEGRAAQGRIGDVELQGARVRVQEQGEGRAERGLAGLLERGGAARAIDLREPAVLARGREQRAGRGAVRRPRERLVADHGPVAQVDDRLEGGADHPGH
jgi:hypothetical protein